MQKPTKNVPQNQRLPQGPGHTTAHNRGTEHVGEVPKEAGFHDYWQCGGLISLNAIR